MTDPKPQFLYQFEATRPEMITDPSAWTVEDNRIAAAHFAYLSKAAEEGVVLLAGRSLDGIGPAVVIFEAGSAETAEAFMKADPFVSSGLMLATLHPFRAALVRKPPV